LLVPQGFWVIRLLPSIRGRIAVGDASVTSWVNVLFAAIFGRTMATLIVPNGQSVFGAYNRKLLS